VILRTLLLAVSALLVGACGTARPLPTVAADRGICRGVGLEAQISGDPRDPRAIWLTGRDGGRMEALWPPGYSVRFTPGAEVLDERGRVVYRAGDQVDGGCTTGPDAQGPLLIHAPDSHVTSNVAD